MLWRMTVAADAVIVAIPKFLFFGIRIQTLLHSYSDVLPRTRTFLPASRWDRTGIARVLSRYG